MTNDPQSVVEFIPQLRSYARSLTRRRDSADDLVQDCLKRALENLDRWQSGTNMRAWLFTIMHNIHISNARRYQGGPQFVTEDNPHSGTPISEGNDLEMATEMRDLENALAALSVEQREIIHLVAGQDLSYAEVASILQIPMGTVMSRLHRAREQLRYHMYGENSTSLRRVK